MNCKDNKHLNMEPPPLVFRICTVNTCLLSLPAEFWFGLRLYFPVNNFSVMSGRSHRFLGITSIFWEVNVSCSRIE